MLTTRCGCPAVVKLQSIVVKSSSAEGRAPRRVKVFTNNASLGFSEATDQEPVQEFTLTEEQVEEGKPLTLRCKAPQMRVSTETWGQQRSLDLNLSTILTHSAGLVTRHASGA